MGKTTKLTTEEFINKARAVHGERYDYSRAAYANASIKVDIICPAHGLFTQAPGQHLYGKGCAKCGLTKQVSKRTQSAQLFKKKAIDRHGTKYDYSKVRYVNNCTGIIIICPNHGEFIQTPAVHLRGSGCRECGKEIIKTKASKSLDIFINTAQKTHGFKYDYSNAIYTGARDLIEVVCPVHGAFQITASSHMRGSGCRKCAWAALIGNTFSPKRSTDSFIEQARAVHGDKYCYKSTEYTGSMDKVKVVCDSHGSFLQTATQHLRGHGCPHCAQDIAREGWIAQAKGKVSILYFLRLYNQDEEFFKIGITCNTITRRYIAKKALNGYSYEIEAQYLSTNAAAVFDWEQSILSTFSHLKYNPKNKFDGASECFSSCEEILSIFPL